MKLRQDKLDELSFLDCMKWIKENALNLSYSKGSNDVYHDAGDIIYYLIRRYEKETNNENKGITDSLLSTKVRLGEYTASYNKSDKMKAQNIARFKSDIEDDINLIIYEIEKK